MTVIRTPDQRVRVFISSTLNELAEERRAAREAISNLRLTPVFFEAGARPHPPRDLYSAYLEQSHIFLGIYWNSYGWVAPGAEISGLEDEYRLCGNKPRLIYLKRSDEREPRLNALLADIERSETACYQLFGDARELGHLIENDLSVLMSETFENSLLGPSDTEPGEEDAPGRGRRLELPHLQGELVGRKEDLDRVAGLLDRASLVTLLGAGGTGKSTLSVHVARRVEAGFPDGAVFVSLAPITDPRLVSATIAESLGLQDTGRQPVEATLAEFLADKRLLLVLDNFEQVAEASRLVGELLARAPGLKLLVTSRTSLHVRGERIYHLGPLSVPPEGARVGPDQLRDYPGTALFVERALAVNSALELHRENAEAIVEICRRLDGLPLAIELAAARTRFFQPAALMARIERTLDLVSRGHRDLPERQRTLRAAIEWSYDLLSDEARRAFRRLGVFKRSWTLEAAEAILGSSEPGWDVEEITERLLDVSLIRPVPVGHAHEPRFDMLQTVHEYAKEALEAATEADETTLAHAEYFRSVCLDAAPHLWTGFSEPWLDRLEHEYQNLRAAFHAFEDRKRTDEAWSMLPCMVPYWTLRGGYSEGIEWIESAGVLDAAQRKDGGLTGVEPGLAGRVMTWCALAYLMLFRMEEGFALLDSAEAALRGTDDRVGLALTLILAGCYGTFVGAEEGEAKLLEGQALAEKHGDPLNRLLHRLWSYEYYGSRGRWDLVERNLREAEELARELGDLYQLGSLFSIRRSLALLEGDPDYDRIAREARALHDLLPEKGYMGQKADAMAGLAFALVMSGRIEEAGPALERAVELARASGEGEALLVAGLAAALHSGRTGDAEGGRQILGAVDALSEASGYPFVGGMARQRSVARDAVGCRDDEALRGAAAYAAGRGMRVEAVIAQALSRV